MTELDWDKIHCGSITRKEIADSVPEPEWQLLRVRLKGTSLEVKYELLRDWLEINNNSRTAQVQVTNYINALKRGGLV